MKEGDYVGHYLLEKHLGEGGFADVWLASDSTAVLDEYKKVAIKIPVANKIDDNLFDSIVKEAKVWKKATGHPNILAFIDAKKYNEHIVIVSEYADSGSLEDLLKGKGLLADKLKKSNELITVWQGKDKNGIDIENCKLSSNKAQEFLVGILSGLDFLHTRRIIHKDLKPANILLQKNVPCLADFGISRAFESTIEIANKTLIIVGTTFYMAPESFDGIRNEQTDIWAIGVIFYKLLTGDYPFDMNGDLYQLISNIKNAEPKPLPSQIPQNLQKIVLGALLKNPKERLSIQKMFELLGVDIVINNHQNIYLEEITLPKLKNSSVEYFNNGLASYEKKEYEEAINWFNQSIYLEPNFAKAFDARGDAFCELKKYEEALKDFDQAIRLDSNNAEFYKNRGVAYAKWKKYKEAFDDLNQAIKMNSENADFFYQRADLFDDLDQYISAADDLTKSIKLDNTNAQYYFGRSHVYYSSDKVDLALEDINKAIQINAGISKYFNLRGLINGRKGDNKTAVKDYSQAIRLNPNVAVYYHNRGYRNFKLRRYDSAINDFKKVVEIKPDYVFTAELIKFQKYWWWYKLINKIKEWW